jgi:hypothetical protein
MSMEIAQQYFNVPGREPRRVLDLRSRNRGSSYIPQDKTFPLQVTIKQVVNEEEELEVRAICLPGSAIVFKLGKIRAQTDIAMDETDLGVVPSGGGVVYVKYTDGGASDGFSDILLAETLPTAEEENEHFISIAEIVTGSGLGGFDVIQRFAYTVVLDLFLVTPEAAGTGYAWFIRSAGGNGDPEWVKMRKITIHYCDTETGAAQADLWAEIPS